MKIKNIFIFILILNLLLPGVVYSFEISELTGCRTNNPGDTYTRLCKNIDDVICQNVPDKQRRSCDEKEQKLVHSGMTANEVYSFAKACFQSGVHSFISFFTEFLPDLCKEIWELTKNVYKSASSPGFFDSIKGAYESAKSVAADTYEAVRKNPGAFFNKIWEKITNAIIPMLNNYDCLSPQAKVEKVCGLTVTLFMPPAKLALLIVKGSKVAKAFIEADLSSKIGKKKASEILASFDKRPNYTLKQYRALYSKYKELGYTLEDFKLMRLNGTLEKIDLKNLKPLTTEEGIEQYTRLTGKALPKKILVEKQKQTKNLKPKALHSPVLTTFKEDYAHELTLSTGANKDYMRMMEIDSHTPNKKTLYFDVENSIQKKLNDAVFIDKNAVDAVNNSFFLKLNANLRKNPELMSRLEGEYKDYKSYRLRLNLKPGDDPAKFEKMFNDLYKKTNDEFVTELVDRKITKILPPMTEGLNNVSSWFLSGIGEDALEANMAARASRTVKRKKVSSALYKDHIEALHKEINGIEELRVGLSSNKGLVDAKILEQTASGKIIPSKAMISILRKTKPSDFANAEEYIAKVKEKSKEIFGHEIDEKAITDLTNYFQKVDSMSPPLFSPERVLVDLDHAKNGIVSIDFAGIGVDNISAQMKALSDVDMKALDTRGSLQKSFQQMQKGVDEVSGEMEKAKDSFSKIISNVEGHNKSSPQFSGDDGIHMPLDKAWGEKDKTKLVQDLAHTEDPSKFRVTFVSTHFPDGKVIPASERSEKIVRAETVEKDIRSKIIGIEKITDEQSKKFITAIDYVPHEKGGVFNLIIGGKNFTPQEIKLIEDSFKSAVSAKDGESIGKIIYSAP